jgi:hypothetical protein
MNTIRKIALACTAVTAVAAPLVVAGSAHADAGSPNCMTRHEWFEIHKGMSRPRVTRIVGITGRLTNSTYYSDGEHDISVDYRQCNKYGKPAKGSWNTVSIDYQNGDYDSDWNWVSGPMQVSYKGSWSSPWSF